MRTRPAPRPLAAAVGIVADQVAGEPPLRPHPVAVHGALMNAVERALYRDGRAAGIAHAALGTFVGLAAGRTVGSTALATYLAVAGRSLAEAAGNVAAALEADDLAAARDAVVALVGRDPSRLDSSEIARATVESVAENTVDAVVAPALWGAVAGAPGALGYRAVNTLDSMVGHRNQRYRRYGWASARLDDLAGYLPARATAALVAAARPGRAGAVVRTVRRDAAAHPSPNAGVAEAAFAAALDLRLGGTNVYDGHPEVRPALGDGRPPAPGDIGRAVALSRDVSLLLAGLLVMTGARRGRRR